MTKLIQVRKTKLNYLTVFVPRPLLVGLLVSKRSILISLQPTCWVNEDHRPLGKHFLEVCLSYFSQNSEYWNPVKHTEMNCNDLYSCRVTSYFVQGPYGSLLSAEINGTTCFTPGRGGRDQCSWNWQRALPEMALSVEWLIEKQPNPNSEKQKPQPVSALSPGVVLLRPLCLLWMQMFGLAIHQQWSLGHSPSWSTAIVLQNARALSEESWSGNQGLTHCWRIVFYVSRAYERKSDWYGGHFAILQCFLSL